MEDVYIYNLIAYRDGVKLILCTYRGDDTALYNFQIEKVKGKTLGDCCGENCTNECACGEE